MTSSENDVGSTWSAEVYYALRMSRARAWMIAVICIVIALSSVIALAAAMPFQKAFPYVVRVNANTGEVDAISVLDTENIELSIGNAMRESLIANYINLRESYVAGFFEEQVEQAALFSAPGIFQNWLSQIRDPDNERSPLVRYKDQYSAEVEVNAITLGANPNTATVRFTVTEVNLRRSSSREVVWNASLAFEFRQEPKAMAERWQNPLGFTVTTYVKSVERGSQ